MQSIFYLLPSVTASAVVPAAQFTQRHSLNFFVPHKQFHHMAFSKKCFVYCPICLHDLRSSLIVHVYLHTWRDTFRHVIHKLRSKIITVSDLALSITAVASNQTANGALWKYQKETLQRHHEQISRWTSRLAAQSSNQGCSQYWLSVRWENREQFLHHVFFLTTRHYHLTTRDLNTLTTTKQTLQLCRSVMQLATTLHLKSAC